MVRSLRVFQHLLNIFLVDPADIPESARWPTPPPGEEGEEGNPSSSPVKQKAKPRKKKAEDEADEGESKPKKVGISLPTGVER
jgi:hypothetical protein